MCLGLPTNTGGGEPLQGQGETRADCSRCRVTCGSGQGGQPQASGLTHSSSPSESLLATHGLGVPSCRSGPDALHSPLLSTNSGPHRPGTHPQGWLSHARLHVSGLFSLCTWGPVVWGTREGALGSLS